MSRPYDVIVVGAGSAGCALARRLSDRADVSVLVEAGGSASTRRSRIRTSTSTSGAARWTGSTSPWRSRAPPGAATCCPAAASSAARAAHQRHGLPARARPRTTTAGRPAAAAAGIGRRSARPSRSSRSTCGRAVCRERNALLAGLHRRRGRGRVPFNPISTRAPRRLRLEPLDDHGRPAAQLLPRVPPSRPGPPQPRRIPRHLVERLIVAPRRRDGRRAATARAGSVSARGRRGRVARALRLTAAPDAAPASARRATSRRSASTPSSTFRSADTSRPPPVGVV